MRENEKVYSDGDIENKIIEALNEGKSDRSICNITLKKGNNKSIQ